MTDLELINLCLSGETDYFEEIVERYKNLVFSIILRKTKNPHEAHDLAQEVFLKAYKNLASYTSEFKFSTWIMRITSNHIIDQYRKKKYDTVSYEVYTAEGGVLGTDSSLEAVYIKREETERINNAVSNLPDIYKVPVVLYHQNGLSYQEIADTIGEPISKVKNRIFRGRKLLKESLVDN